MLSFKRFLFFFILILYEEVIFMFFSKGFLYGMPLKILFTLQIALLLSSVFLFNKKTNKVISNILVLILPMIYISQYIYNKIFGGVLTLGFIFESSQVIQFSSQFLSVLLSNWYIILLFILPIFVYIILKNKIRLEKNTKIELFIIIFLFQVIYFMTTMIISFDKEEDIYSIKNLYYNIDSSINNLEEFGVLTTVRLDIQRTIFKFEEKQLYKYEDSEGNIKILDEANYNMTKIDFDTLIKNEDNDEIKELHQYFKNQEPTNKNEYTGIFEGKNVIVILGESFSSLAINEEVTPTLYKLSNSGFKFNNFYTPLFPVSTSDGQYLTDTSLVPVEGLWSMQEVEGKMFPYVYGNVFKELGYKTYAYHNYDYDYYDRDVYFDTFGYDEYLGCGNGLEEKMECSIKFSSDYEMVKTTINDYVEEDKFFAYYVTMSGHMNYDSSNNIVNKNWDKVKDFPYSDKAKAYLATQIELDRAVEEIISTLEENNKLEDTVIIISGDHYPYGLSESEIKELSPYDMNNYNIERFHMPFIIYSGENQETVEVDKYGSSMDILPTVLNLFGVEYDSRLLMGKDIFSDSEPLIIFSDRSFITNDGIYNSKNRVFIPSKDTNKDYSEYVKDIQQQIYLKYRSSRLMLKNDYYKYVIK